MKTGFDCGHPIKFTAPVQQGRAEMVTVTCKGCGAVNIIPRGQAGECEYCGSGIKG